MGTIANGGKVTIENPDFFSWIHVAEGRIDEIRISCIFKDENSGKRGRLTIAVEEITLDQSEEYNWALVGFIDIKNAPIAISISYSERKNEAWYAISSKKEDDGDSDFEQIKKDAENFFGKDFSKEWPFGK